MRDYSASQNAVKEGSNFVAGGVNSNFRYGTPPNPLLFKKAEGAILTDIDGNSYIDYYLGMGAMLLGHSPKSVISAAQLQLSESILVAGQTILEYQAAKLLTEMVPSAELVRFASSGTEAIHAAFRVVRAKTGRHKIIKFEGHYHGWTDNAFISATPSIADAGNATYPNSVPGSLGQELDPNIVVLQWNDIAALEEVLSHEDIAAVITEPIMFNNGGLMPIPGFHEKLRDLTTLYGTILIYDEVITGFRVSAGGAQAVLGVTPDLTILGKALANGFPVAALVGKRDLFDQIINGSVLHGGTYNSQSISMAATVQTLTDIQSGKPHKEIDALSKTLRSGLEDIFSATSLDYEIVGYSAVFQMRFGSHSPNNYRSDLQTNKSLYQSFASKMLEQGIRLLPRGTWFLSSAHTDQDINETLRVTKMVVKEMGL